MKRDVIDIPLDISEEELKNIVYFPIKSECLEVLFLLIGKLKGLGTLNTPRTSASLSDYMLNVSLYAGYPLELTMYSWRRSAGNNVFNTLRSEAASRVLSYQIGSKVCLQYFNLCIDIGNPLNFFLNRSLKNVVKT